MRFNKSVPFLLFLCAVWLYGCATSTPRSSEPQPPATTQETTAEKTDKSEPVVSPSAKRDYERALAAVKAKRHKQAERMLLEIIRAYADLAGPHVNLGIVYYRTGRLKEAEGALKNAIEINPQRTDAYNHLGIVLRRSGRFKEAREAYEKALRLDPDYEYAHLNLGILYDLYLLDAPKALDQYERYQKLLSEQDKQVAKWIVDLKRRIGRTKKKTAMR